MTLRWWRTSVISHSNYMIVYPGGKRSYNWIRVLRDETVTQWRNRHAVLRQNQFEYIVAQTVTDVFATLSHSPAVITDSTSPYNGFKFSNWTREEKNKCWTNTKYKIHTIIMSLPWQLTAYVSVLWLLSSFIPKPNNPIASLLDPQTIIDVGILLALITTLAGVLLTPAAWAITLFVNHCPIE